MDITSPQVWIGWIIAGLTAYLGVYLAEKAKRRAAHEDSDQIRAELARNTQAVKDIEAKITGREWQRQWLLQQKRDAYTQAIQVMYEMHTQLNLLAIASAQLDDAKADDSITKLEQLAPAMKKAQALVAIVGSAEAIKGLDEASTPFQPLRSDVVERTEQALTRFIAAVDKFQSAVRQEFAADPHPSNDL